MMIKKEIREGERDPREGTEEEKLQLHSCEVLKCQLGLRAKGVVLRLLVAAFNEEQKQRNADRSIRIANPVKQRESY